MNRRFTLLVLFFFSGAVGLAYEIVWARQLSLFLGASIYAVSAVLIAFMGGLGAGAEIFGRRLDKGLSPIRLYVALEIALGTYVLMFPAILSLLENVYVFLHSGTEAGSIQVIALRATLAVMALLPPTILMGGTLPALVRFFEMEPNNRTGKIAGGLYAINTLGAMTGCVVTGFVLIEALGLTGTLRFGVFVNFLAGAIAWIIAREPGWHVGSGKPGEKAKTKTGGEHRWDTTLLTLYGVSGFCALALELLWTRTLILLLNNTTYAFTLILAVFLFGIAAGSAITSRFIKKSRQHSVRLFAYMQVGIGVTALMTLVSMAINQSVIGVLSGLVGDSGSIARSVPGGEPMVSAILFAFIIVTPCALLMGGCFPLVINTISSSREHSGGDVGRVYAVNIVGSVMGSIAAGYILIPVLGLQKSLMFISWVSIAAGLYLLSNRFQKLSSGAVVATLIICLPLTGALAYNSDIAFTLSAQKLDKGSEVEFYQEGASATVLVSSQESDLSAGRKPVKRLWINGDPIAGAFREALQLERLQAHIPLLLHPNPKNALVICFGTGSTAGAALSHGLEKVTAVDISQEVFNAGVYFKTGNLDVMNSARLSTIEEDGRNFLLTTDRLFDFITSEPPPPSNSGIVSLYTEEFYQLAKKKLNPGGIVSQWIPLHHLSLRDFKMLVASFIKVFPKATMWYTKWDAIMIGAKEEIPIDLDRIKNGMKNREVANSLAGIGIETVYQLMANYMMGPDELREYASDVPSLTDDAPVVEFSAPRVHAIGVKIKGGNLASLLKYRSKPKHLEGLPDQERFDAYMVSQALFWRGQVAMNDDKRGEAASYFNKALKMNNNNSDARYAYLSLNLRTLFSALGAGKSKAGLRMLRDTESMDREGVFTPQLKFLNGMFLAQSGKYFEAERMLEEAIALDDKYLLAYVNLAGLYSSVLDQPGKAKQLYKRALKLNASKDERRMIATAMNRLTM
ncbi:Spermidine synthase [hydrothermal vent metagenome]|uniref:Spermidine synthase n=1 Tax=hydrothermal vent metagenome TaxID=652676 RepID=A0A3B1D1D2_9ZZZZ